MTNGPLMRSRFEEFVMRHADAFAGQLKETHEVLEKVERELNVKLPHDIKWLLSTLGYGQCTGIPNIEESISQTLEARKTLSLPNNFIVIQNNYDGGAVLLDSIGTNGSFRVIDIDWALIPENILGEIVYPDLIEWAMDNIEAYRYLLISDLICRYEDEKTDIQTVIEQITEITGREIDTYAIENYWRSESLHIFVQKISFVELYDWYDMTDEKAATMINQLRDVNCRISTEMRNTQELSQRYRKTEGELEKVIYSEISVIEAIRQLKEDTVIYL